MSRKSLLLAIGAGLLAAMPAFAGSIEIHDAYARSASPAAKSGAAFMVIRNTGAEDDQLIAAASDAAMRVELHTHIADGNGVMQMRQVEGGFAVPAGGEHVLARGGDHVMMMGLNGPLNDGETVTVTLTFQKAGDMVIEVPVDLTRKPDHGGMQHGTMGQGASN